MILKVKNFAKIKEANIEINGITIIAGENNTGKSTIGKILFAIYRCFHNLEEKVNNEKKKAMYSTVLSENKMFFNKNFLIKENMSIIDMMDVTNYDNFFHSISDYNLEFTAEEKIKIDEIINYDDEWLESLIVNEVFNKEFNNQLLPINNKRNKTCVSLTIKDLVDDKKIEKNIEIFFRKRGSEIKNKINLYKEAVYIDNPFIIDRVHKPTDMLFKNIRYYVGLGYVYENHNDILLNKLNKSINKNNYSLIENALLEERLVKFEQVIRETINGDFVENENDFAFFDSKLNKEIELGNLSTGIKSFLILLKLIKNHDITDNSLIILDEPEIHLHPTWQLEFASLLVLLQKEFNLNIVLTTHSPYFINAIEVYAKKYDSEDKCKYYLSLLKEQNAYFEDVTNNRERIYEKLLRPFQILENELSKYD